MGSPSVETDTSNAAGHGPGQRALADPACAGPFD